ncbi:hypothetical protein JCM10449v2_006576 [Rhodotorula kratochvilovae]
MPPVRHAAQRASVYTPPAVFYELERDFQRQGRKRAGGTRSMGSGGEKRVLQPHGGGRASRDDEGASEEEEEEDQLASSADEDFDEWLLAQADGLDRAVSGQGRHRKKRVKNGRGRSSGQRKRDMLRSLPEEVLVNIISYLPLSALQAFAHLSSWLRNFLLDDAVDPIWANARAADGLPELSAGEWVWEDGAVAELVHGKTCAMCGVHSARWPDAFVRIRLCKKCRSANIVRLYRLKETHPALHPAVKDCVIRSLQAPSNPHHRSKTAYGFLPSLNAHDDALWALQERDEQDDERFYAEQFAAASSGTRSRPSGGGGGSEDGDGGERGRYDLAPRRKEGEWGRRVREYVRGRREKCEAVEREGGALFEALVELYAAEDATNGGRKNGNEQSSARRKAIEARVLALDTEDKWTQDDFEGAWLDHKLINTGLEEITDPEWVALQPKVLNVLRAARKKRLAAVAEQERETRREALRPAYYALRTRQQTAAARVWTPLFADFLLFPSVLPLWEPAGATVDAAAIAAAQDGIDEDLNEWRTGIRLHTLRLALANTLDIPDDEELDSDADALTSDVYGDDFFELVGAGVMCAVEGCYQPARGKKGAPEHEPAQPTFFGSLTEVLLHQQIAHDDLVPSAREVARARRGEERGAYRVALPLEVSNAVVAICDAASLDDETATAEDLDEVFETEGAWVRWWNLPGGGNGRKEKDWRAVLCHIYRHVVKAARSRPPTVIPIPVIELNLGKE